MKTLKITLVVLGFALLFTGCRPPVATSTPAAEPSALPTATLLPPTATATPEPTPTSPPTQTPTATPEPTPWRPQLASEPCVPSSTRTCRVVFVLPAQYYAESGRSYPDQFREAGYAVTIASNAPEVVEVCANTVGADQPAKNIPVDVPLTDVQVADYDAVLFIGGLGCQDQWEDDEAHHIAQETVAQGKVLGAAGCAPTILAYAGVLQGKTAVVCTSKPPVKHGKDYCEVLQSQGALCSSAEIARDGLIVTARQKSRYFVAGVIEVLRETLEATPPAAALILEKSAQALGMRETFQAALGDLDGDGDLDAVFANPMRNHGQVWLNDGRGTFVNTGQQLTQYGHGVGLADFDADGDLDAVMVCHQNSAATKVYLNDGAGILTATAQDFGDARISAADMNLLDLNGDGFVDIHVLYYSESGVPDKVYLNEGGVPGGTPAVFLDSGLLLDEDFIAWGDLDGDGDVDYFGKHWGEGYGVMLNDGGVQGGTLGQFTLGWQMEDQQASVGDVALADFDGDGDLDAMISNGFRDTGSRPARLLWNDGSGVFTGSGLLLNETMGAHFAVGDLDLDGRLDVVVTNMDRPNEVWLNRGAQFLDSGLRLGDATEMSGRPTLGDLDGDGDLDIVIGRFRGGAEIWFND